MYAYFSFLFAFILRFTSQAQQFAGAACKRRVVLTLQKKYITPIEAERVVCAEAKEPDMPFNLVATVRSMRLSDHPVSYSN